MSDNLGINQTRVLDSADRSFDQVVYQKRKPPLSCEVNFTGRLSSDQARSVARMSIPSGWEIVGPVLDGASEATVKAGTVICSPSYDSNSFKFMASDQGIVTGSLAAWVDGFRVVVQGTNSISDENNVITLPTPPTMGNRVDFVFLEVWRKLLQTGDSVYKHGNIQYGGINPANDLIDPAAGIETSLRVQVQYRIRVATCDVTTYPDGFDPSRVFAQAALADPLSCTLAAFVQDPNDVGLWRAGNGDSASQQTLGTVDGYSYAIPMFMVTRRNTGAYHPDARSNGSVRTRADFILGYGSDRPDELYNDVIAARDILDMRHRVSTSLDLKALAEEAFTAVMKGEIAGKMTGTTVGEDSYGTTILQCDAVVPTDKAGSVTIAAGDGKARYFANASGVQKQTISGLMYASGPLSVNGPGSGGAPLATYPAGTVISSVDGAWNATGQLSTPSQYTVSGVGTATVTVTFIGVSFPANVQYTVTYPSSTAHGLSQLPVRFLESRPTDSTVAYAMTSDAIRVHPALAVGTIDGTMFDMVVNKGAGYEEPWDFGHQMIKHIRGAGINSVYVPRTLNGFSILGVAKVLVSGVEQDYSVSRTATEYTVTVSGPAIPSGADVELTLYTGGTVFQGSRQGRGIIDSYQMMELTPMEAVDGIRTIYTVDATNAAILAVASSSKPGLGGAGTQLTYVDNVAALASVMSTNSSLPTDATSSRAVITYHNSFKPTVGQTVSVPVLVRTAIGASEGFQFFYDALPYQGVVNTTAVGSVLAQGPSITTTAGSGTIEDQTYAAGTATFVSGSANVAGVGTLWQTFVAPGDLISANTYDSTKYVVKAVASDTQIEVTEGLAYNAASTAYTVTRKDVPMKPVANIVDRLPILSDSTDALCKGEAISTATSDAWPVLSSRVMSAVQDVVDVKGITLGSGGAASRGRKTVSIPGAMYGVGALGLKFEKLATTGNRQRTYQSYVFDRDDSGRLYLMVVGSEDDGVSASRFFDHMTGNDTVDLFELPGRPIL